MLEEQITIGCVEIIDFPEFGLKNVQAKIDTGAYSGAIHAEDIHLSDDKSTLLFSLPGGHKDIATHDFLEVTVTSALGHQEDRYVINTKVQIQGESYPIRIGLSNREKMRFPVLLGRRFLRENGFLVDVRINQEYDTDGDSKELMTS